MSVGWRAAVTLCSMIYECETNLNDTLLTSLEICTTSVPLAPVFLLYITAETSTSCQLFSSVSINEIRTELTVGAETYVH